MADRSVVVRLQANVSDFKNQLAVATKSVEDLGKKSKDSSDAAATGLGRMVQSADKNRQAWSSVGGVLLGVGTAAAAGVGLAVKAYADFDKAMSNVKAATHESAANMELLRGAAMKAGADTKFSATEAAGAVEELAKAGVSTRDILKGGLSGALSLAAAGNLEVGEAAEIAASAMTQFGLSGAKIPHIADLLAAGAGKAQGSVHDMGAALNQVGLVASQTGLSVEDTTGALAAFASAGLTGSDAGTSFKTMLQALNPQSAQAKDLMEKLGISAYDSQGNFVGLTEYAGRLQDGLSGLSAEQRNAALQTIFGSDAVRAASVLYKDGAAGIQGWIDKVNDTGYAAVTAATNMDNLSGDLETLKGSIDSALIGTGEAADGPLRDLVQHLNEVVNWYGQLGDGAQGAVLGVGAVTAAVGLAGGAFLTLAPKVLDVITGWKTLSTTSPELAGKMTAVGKAAGIAGAALGLLELTAQLADLVTVNDPAARGLGETTKALLAMDDAAGRSKNLFNYGDGIHNIDDAIEAMTGGGPIDRLNRFGQTLDGVFGTNIMSKRNAAVDQFHNIDASLAQLVSGGNAEQAASSFQALYGQVDQTKYSTDDLMKILPGYRDALASQDAQQQLTAQSAGTMAGAADAAGVSLSGISPAAGSAYESLQTYAASLGYSKDATEALVKSSQDLGSTLAGFVDPLGTYTALLDAKIAKEGEAKGSTDATSASGQQAWLQFADGAGISIDRYLDDLQKQVDAQTNWQTNMLALAGRVSAGTIAELAKMGPEGAPLVADLVNASDAELQRFSTLTAKRSKEATDAWGSQLTLAQPVLAQIGKTAGQGVVDSLAAQLAAGTTTVAEIAAKYGISLANGVNPVLTSLGKAAIKAPARNGGAVAQFADGGVEDHSAQIAPAGAMRLWAEPETGGEAYIPLAAEKRGRSTDIWRQVGKRLGVQFAEFASGGFFNASDVPKPPSVAPYTFMVGDPASAAMGAGYDATSGWVKSMMGAAFASGPGGGPAGAGVQRWLPMVLQALSILGEPASLAQVVLRRMQQESGGNPAAVNNWDINAKRGTPSKGLMQVIDPTFRAYAMPGHNSSVFDPLSNILASMRYAEARYGSLPRAYNRAGGYDSGGLANGVGMLPKYTVEPERVLSPQQTKWFEAAMRSASSQDAGARVNVTVVADGPEIRTQAEAIANRTVTKLGDVLAANGIHAIAAGG